MGHGGELLRPVSAHLLGGRIRCDGIRVFLFQGLKAVHQHVILVVGDDRRVLVIVESGIVLQLFPDLFDLLKVVHIAFSYSDKLT